MNSTEHIQEVYRNGLLKTVPEFENCKQQLFTLTCAYQRTCEFKLLGPRFITRSQLERFLQNVMTINFTD